MNFIASRNKSLAQKIGDAADTGGQVVAGLEGAGTTVIRGEIGLMLYDRMIKFQAGVEVSNWEFAADVHDPAIIDKLTQLGASLQDHFFDILDHRGMKPALQDLNKPVSELGVDLVELDAIVAHINSKWEPTPPLDAQALRQLKPDEFMPALIHAMAADYVHDPDFVAG